MPDPSTPQPVRTHFDPSRSVRTDLAKRSAFLGVVAWLSVCLIATAMFPNAVQSLNRLWMLSGVLGLVSAVALMQVVARDQQRNLELLAQLHRDSNTDALTGVSNRRELDRCLAELVVYCQQTDTPLCVMMIDIDYFKRLNDTYGHGVGDHVLKSTGATLSRFVRSTDFVSRYGGEEFVVVSPGVDLATARTLSERIRVAVQQQPLPDEAAETEVTISIGLTAMMRDDAPTTILSRADNALYSAKKAGRNCTFCFVDGIYLAVTQPPLDATRTPPFAPAGGTDLLTRGGFAAAIPGR